jgi:hypothetical protein
MDQEDEAGQIIDRKNQLRSNNAEKHQDCATASKTADTSLPPAANRQACVSLNKGSESRLKAEARRMQRELASRQEPLRRIVVWL